MIIAFQTPPLPPIASVPSLPEKAGNDTGRLFSRFCRSPPSDRLQLPVDDTIVKPHRLVNKTLGNITQMSFVSALEESCFLRVALPISSSILIRTTVHHRKRMKRRERRNFLHFSLHYHHHQHRLSSARQRSSIHMHSSLKRVSKRRNRRKKSTLHANLSFWLAAMRRRKPLIGKNVPRTTSKTKRTSPSHGPKVIVRHSKPDKSFFFFSFRLEITDR